MNTNTTSQDTNHILMSIEIESVIMVAKAAYADYQIARFTFEKIDILIAKKTLSSAIVKIHALVFESIQQVNLIAEFRDLQEWEQTLNDALDWLITVQNVLKDIA